MPHSEWKRRTSLLLGESGIEKLHNAKVLVAGLGGVGAQAAEQLCRAGVGHLTIVDGDCIHPTNRNRQLAALVSTEGLAKTDVMSRRLLDINPLLSLTIIQEYIKDERLVEVLDGGYDYVVDAIDTLSPKVYLVYNALKLGLPVVSSMGAGGKIDPGLVQVNDLSVSHTCKLAYYMRKHLHRLGVFEGVKVVFSPEVVSRESIELMDGEVNKKSTVGTISYMPAVFGCFCASVVIRDIVESRKYIVESKK
jgi:tRNA threonylcarbamoyladenosine dehydratase